MKLLNEIGKAKYLDLKTVDIDGRIRHLVIPAKRVNESLMKNGVGFDASNLGYASVSSSDMLMYVDESTLFFDPFYQEPTLSAMCYVKDTDNNMIDFYPRNMILKLKNVMKESSIADDAILGVELEFYIFNNVKFFTKTNSSMYEIDTNEGFWNEEVPKMPLHKGYHSTIPNDIYADVRNAMATTLEDIGIPVRYHHHEVGSAQQEIELSLIDIYRAADNTTISKYLIKNLANTNDLTVTFMPKPIFGEAGSGMHVHQYLTKEGKNVFLGKKYKNLSQKGLYYIGGILKHAKALSALTNPSTNSYKRLIPGYEAPVSICFGAGNRSAAIRIPTYIKDLQETRMEYRPIDAMSNAYYAFTAMVLAGLDGIINKIDPVKLGFGPVEKNVYESENTFDFLPKDLEEALYYLDKDREFLKLGNIFSDDLINLWIERKKEENNKIREVPNPLEFEYYYDF